VIHASGAGAEPLGRYRYRRRGGAYRLVAATRRRPAGPARAAGSGAVVTTRWRYDEEGLAVAQLDANGRERLRILRDGPVPAPPGGEGGAADGAGARVRHADGTERRYAWRDAEGSDAARHDARLAYTQGPVPSPLPVEEPPGPADEPLLLRHLSQLRPVPGSLDALLPAEATGSRFDVRLKATVQGGVTDVRVGERSLAELQRRRASGEGGDGGGGVCQPAGNGGELLDRVATASQPCTTDLVELEWLRRGAERYALRGRAARKGGLFSRDPFCELPGGKDCAQLRDHYAMAQLSGCVYPDSNSCAPGWTRIDPERVGLPAEEFSIGRFHAALFQDSSTGRFVLVYRGTDAVNDMIDHFSQSLGITAGQYDQAMNLARSVEQTLVLHHPGATLEYAGHSLGGGLATAAALDRHQPGTVFNPSELSVLTAAFNRFEYFEAPRLLEVLRVENEFVGLTHSIVGPPGEVTLIGRPAGVHFWEMLDAHGIRAVIASIKTYLDRHCPATP